MLVFPVYYKCYLGQINFHSFQMGSVVKEALESSQNQIMRYVVLPNKSIFSINQKTLVQTQGYFKPQFKFLIFVFLFKAEAIYEYIPKIQSEIYHQLLHKQTHESSEDPKLTCMVYPNNHKILFTIAILGFEGR